jgi:hypothetical protein
MTRRFLAGIATGLLIVGLAGAGAVAHTASTAAASPLPATAAAPSVAPASTRQAANRQTTGGAGKVTSQGGTSGESTGAVVIAGKGGGYTVTAINGNTITATANAFAFAGGPLTPGGPDSLGGSFRVQVGVPGKQGPGILNTSPVTVTITVDSSTTFTRAGQTASLSDVQVGSVLNVEGAVTGTTIAATKIEIVLPERAGVVTAVNGNSLTLTGFDARTYTISTGSSTVYQRAGQASTASDIAVGSLISAEGTLSSDGSTLNALEVTIELPHVAGQVTAVNGNTLTVQSPDGTTATVLLTGTTTYSAGPQGTASKSDITTGSFIVAEGTLGSDGSLTALQVDIPSAVRGSIGTGTSFSVTVPGGDAIMSTGMSF